MSNTAVHRFAYFITPHGYGHAARSVAVMNAVYHSQPGTMFDIYTRVPLWFFQMSNEGEFHYHELLTHIGLVQTTSMEENLPETVRRLDEFLPFDRNLVQSLARQVRQDGCEKVLCDIAPFGIAVARAAGIPSVLVENFTWDWIDRQLPPASAMQSAAASGSRQVARPLRQETGRRNGSA